MKKSKSVYLMGTKIDLSISHPNVDQIIEDVISLLKVYEHRFSANDPNSELSRVNQYAGIRPVKVHPELYELIKIGKKHSLSSKSHLNIAIGPLVQSWRIGFADAKKPTDQEIQKQIEKIDPNQVLLKGTSVYLKSKGMAIDLGALAKGYIADRIIDYLVSVHVESALLNLGGNIVTMGPATHHADLLWRVGIRKPEENRENSQIILKVSDQSIVTSGIYERQLTENGQNYHHMFDSKTGYPIKTDTVSLTIVSDRSVDGEIWTSRLFGQSTTDIMRFLQETRGVEGILINKQGDIHYSDGIEQLLT